MSFERVISMVSKKCHIFTPQDIVIKMLDEIGYEKNLFGKKFLENSCGEGNILKEAIKRYIDDCLYKNMTILQIKSGLEHDFVGIEYDKNNHKKCIDNLNTIANQYGIFNVSWGIICDDFLTFNQDHKFDFIVGNPPYISYGELDDITRNYIRENFTVCKRGKFDYYYPFIEKSLNLLKKNGKFSYLIPTNLFKNVFAKDLRELIKCYISRIYDYTTEKIFGNILTSSSIIICDLENKTDFIEYYDVSENKKKYINKERLYDKWIFNSFDNKQKVLFSEYFLAATSVATLYNEAFVIKDYIELDNHLLASECKIEKTIIRKAASPRSFSKNKQEMIIFPYYFIEGKLLRYSEEEFLNLFPEASKYLAKFRNKLDARYISSDTKWFEYGRTQALDKLNQKKLMMSFIVTNRVNLYELDEKTIPYSGVYIIPKSNLSLEKAKEILKSDKFLEYVKNIGIHISGTSLRITANDIKNFDISEWS